MLAADAQVNDGNPKVFYSYAKDVARIIRPPKSENHPPDKRIKSSYRWEEGRETKPPWRKLIIVFCCTTITRNRRKVV